MEPWDVQSDSTGGSILTQEYKLYPSRFAMLTLYSLIGCINNAIWVAYTPITSSAATTYDVSQALINLLAATYLLTTIFLIPLGSWLCDVKGPQATVIVCAILNTLGAWIKVLGGRIDGGSYWIVFAGQFICAIAQPLFLPAPPKIAANWFGESERALCTAIGSLSVVSGIAVGYGLSIWLVGDEDDCCKRLDLVLAILMTVPSVLGVIFFRNHPPTPPSASSESERDEFFESMKRVLKERSFIVLLCTVSPGYGLFAAVFSIVGDLVGEQGYSETLSGLVGVVLVLSGLVGAIVFGAILDETKKFIFLIKLGFVLAGVSVTFFVLSLQFTLAPWIVLVFSVFAGFFLSALLPMCIEFGVEICYPASEGVVAGLLLLVGNLYGLIFFAFLGIMIQKSNGSTVALWFLLFVCWCCCIGSLFLYGECKRMKFEGN